MWLIVWFIVLFLFPSESEVIAAYRCRERIEDLDGQTEWTVRDEKWSRTERRRWAGPRNSRHRTRSDDVGDDADLDQLVYRDSKAALRLFLRRHGREIDQQYLNKISGGRDVNHLEGNEAFGIYHSLQEERAFAPIRYAQREKFPGYYSQFESYGFGHPWERSRRMDVALYRSRGLPIPSDRSAVFLDTSFSERHELNFLYTKFPSLEGREDDFTLLPSSASEQFTITVGSGPARTQPFWLSSQFSNELSAPEAEGLKGILKEFEAMGIGDESVNSHPKITMDRNILAEAMLAASKSKDGRAELWLRDHNFIVPLWMAARRMSIPFENESYKFEVFDEHREIDGIKIPVVRIVMSRPLRSELVVIHPYMRDGDRPGRIVHVLSIGNVPRP